MARASKSKKPAPPAYRVPTRTSDQDLVERSPSGGARCHACKRLIAEGEWRFGEWVDQSEEVFDDGRVKLFHRHFHLDCATARKPVPFLRAMLRKDGPPLPAREWYLARAVVKLIKRYPPAFEEVLLFHDSGEGVPHLVYRAKDGTFGCVTEGPRGGKPAIQAAATRDDAFALLPEPVFREAKPISVSRPAPPSPAPARAPSPIQARCPACGEADVVLQGAYRCAKGCGFQFSAKILQQPIEPDQMEKWIKDGRTDLLHGFVSKKTGRPFSARLVRTGRDRMEFEFPGRTGEEA